MPLTWISDAGRSATYTTGDGISGAWVDARPASGAKNKVSLEKFRQGVKAILVRWARDARIESVVRLKNQTTTLGAPMAPLSVLWSHWKEDRGLLPEIGQSTGAMLEEVGNLKNDSVRLEANGVRIEIALSRDPTIQFRAKMFESGFHRPIKSVEEERKLKSMRWVQAGNKFMPDGRGLYAQGNMLYCPPRPFWGASEELTQRAAQQLQQLIISGLRKI